MTDSFVTFKETCQSMAVFGAGLTNAAVRRADESSLVVSGMCCAVPFISTPLLSDATTSEASSLVRCWKLHETHRQSFAEIGAALGNSEFYRSVLPDLDHQVTMENVIYRVRFLFQVGTKTRHPAFSKGHQQL
jgi:hypothetical protein